MSTGIVLVSIVFAWNLVIAIQLEVSWDTQRKEGDTQIKAAIKVEAIENDIKRMEVFVGVEQNVDYEWYLLENLNHSNIEMHRTSDDVLNKTQQNFSLNLRLNEIPIRGEPSSLVAIKLKVACSAQEDGDFENKAETEHAVFIRQKNNTKYAISRMVHSLSWDPCCPPGKGDTFIHFALNDQHGLPVSWLIGIHSSHEVDPEYYWYQTDSVVLFPKRDPDGIVYGVLKLFNSNDHLWHHPLRIKLKCSTGIGFASLFLITDNE